MEKDLNTILSENLAYYRKLMGLTQIQLAEELNYSDKSISKWERGEGTPDVLVLKNLANFYGITVDDFFKEEKKDISQNISRLPRKKMYIAILSIALAWVVAAITFFSITLSVDWEYVWLVFLYAVVVSSILGVIWSSIYHSKRWQLVTISLLIWSSAISIHLTLLLLTSLNASDLPFIYIVAATIQILFVIWFCFKKYKEKHRK